MISTMTELENLIALCLSNNIHKITIDNLFIEFDKKPTSTAKDYVVKENLSTEYKPTEISNPYFIDELDRWSTEE